MLNVVVEALLSGPQWYSSVLPTSHLFGKEVKYFLHIMYTSAINTLSSSMVSSQSERP